MESRILSSIERLLPNRIARMVKRADLEDNMDLRRLASVGDRERERLDRYRGAWTRIVSVDDLGWTSKPA